MTVIPINDVAEPDESQQAAATAAAAVDDSGMNVEFVEYENHTYGAIFDFDDKLPSQPAGISTDRGERISVPVAAASPLGGSREELKDLKSPRRHETSPRRGRERKRETVAAAAIPPPPPPNHPVFRRLSERRHEGIMSFADGGGGGLNSGGGGGGGRINIHKKIRRKSRRSSSLGPLLDLGGSEMGASTHSLESVDSNPRQAVPKSDRALGAIPRRQQPPPPASPTHPLVGSPTRPVTDLPPGVRPPPYHPLAASMAGNSGGGGGPGATGPAGFPLMVPLPGLTCQFGNIPPPPPPVGGMSLPPAGVGLGEAAPPVGGGGRAQLGDGGGGGGRSVREQQVVRLRQELAHPAGVRLILR